MDIHELSDRKQQLESDIRETVSNLVERFQNENEINLDDVKIDFIKHYQVGSQPRLMVLDVEAQIKL